MAFAAAAGKERDANDTTRVMPVPESAFQPDPPASFGDSEVPTSQTSRGFQGFIYAATNGRATAFCNDRGSKRRFMVSRLYWRVLPVFMALAAAAADETWKTKFHGSGKETNGETSCGYRGTF